MRRCHFDAHYGLCGAIGIRFAAKFRNLASQDQRRTGQKVIYLINVAIPLGKLVDCIANWVPAIWRSVDVSFGSKLCENVVQIEICSKST